jgi:hypothetical protein
VKGSLFIEDLSLHEAGVVRSVHYIVGMYCARGGQCVPLCRVTKHSSKFAFPQTRLPHTITMSALDGSNKHNQFIETLAKETHIMRTLSPSHYGTRCLRRLQ